LRSGIWPGRVRGGGREGRAARAFPCSCLPRHARPHFFVSTHTAPVFAARPPPGAPPGFAAAATHPLATFLATPAVPAELAPYLAPPAPEEAARVGGRRRKQ